MNKFLQNFPQFYKKNGKFLVVAPPFDRLLHRPPREAAPVRALAARPPGAPASAARTPPAHSLSQ